MRFARLHRKRCLAYVASQVHFGCALVATVVACLLLNQGVRLQPTFDAQLNH